MTKEKTWKELRSDVRNHWEREINALTSDETLRVIALKGAIRTLDERFASAESKTEVVSGKKEIPTLQGIAKTIVESRTTLTDKAQGLLRIAVEQGKVTDKLLSLLVKPTKESIKKAEKILS